MVHRPIHTVTPSVQFLRHLAVLELPPAGHTELKREAERSFGPALGKTSWQELVSDAERHGLAALLFKHLHTLDIDVAPEARQQLQSLRIRHRRANAARAEAVEAILCSFDEVGIRAVLLKGAALVSEIYPEPSMRPMSDIDILVDGSQAEAAQRCLLESGYGAEAAKTGTLFDHHHLPMASIEIDGVAIHVEIHHDALSGDVDSSITMDTLTEPLRTIKLIGRDASALGHVDTLRHLCHHTFEPIAEIKLGAIVDLYGYASHHIDDLDIVLLDRRYPFVRNIFRLLNMVTPLPVALEKWVQSSGLTAVSGAGFGYPPMSETLSGSGGRFARIGGLLSAPDWWLHGFYNVPPTRSITWTRYVRHPYQVAKWLERRARATLRHRRAARQKV